jgi:hypothetical protein
VCRIDAGGINFAEHAQHVAPVMVRCASACAMSTHAAMAATAIRSG